MEKLVQENGLCEKKGTPEKLRALEPTIDLCLATAIVGTSF
jgi:hypothetical protein